MSRYLPGLFAFCTGFFAGIAAIVAVIARAISWLRRREEEEMAAAMGDVARAMGGMKWGSDD